MSVSRFSASEITSGDAWIRMNAGFPVHGLTSRPPSAAAISLRRYLVSTAT